MFRPMKPETIVRKNAERADAAIVRKAVMIARIERKVAEHGWESIWAELLAEAKQEADA